MVERVTPLPGSRPPPANPLLELLALSRRARQARSTQELAFLLVNDTHGLRPYRQAVLWMQGQVKALSGVVEPEANAPYVQWLHRACTFLQARHAEAAAIAAVQLPAELAPAWAEWLPPCALWLPLFDKGNHCSEGGLLLAAEDEWPDEAVPLLKEWMDVWQHAWHARTRSSDTLWTLLARAGSAATPGWRRRRVWAAVAALAALFVPVRLSVLAPGELVPAQPAVIRAPIDGVIGAFHVQPNQAVQAGQPLFGFDEASLTAQREVSAQALATAQNEYRQQAQQAVSDARSKAQLAALLGRIEEKRAEADYLGSQLSRSRVSAPQAGIALFDDPSEWTGKPVQTGERIMRIAVPGDVEVEAWLPIGDAIPLPDKATVQLYLAADPMTPVTARVRYVAHEAVLRPDGSYAYRVRAGLDQPTDHRVGLKGTAKLNGDTVPLAYWVLRRPWATLRQWLGW